MRRRRGTVGQGGSCDRRCVGHRPGDRPPSRGRGAGEENIKQLAARSPVRRLGGPEDIAATTAFLCSDDAGYITGQVIGVNGGNYT